ncbi:MAG: PcfJ domain-containing protein [Alphaproteobacteria bacterium]|nr:PcfJ domain-containing protein [Alphaproteobacteria bacterium]
MLTKSEKEKAIAHQIARFERSARRRLRKLAGLSPRLGDLILSFPGAAFAIATNSFDPDRTGEAVRRARDGLSLRDVAQPLGLPMWLKRVPPEAFAGRLSSLPDGEKFARQIAGRIPQNPAYASCWLNWVSFAGTAGDEDFALWIAAQKPPFVRAVPINQVPLRPLALFAWFSIHGQGPARELIEKPWQPSMRFETATEATRRWLDSIASRFRPQRPRRGPGRYSRQRKAAGLRMVPLRNGSQLRDEGRAMNHCVGTYAHLVASGECLIFSLRTGENRVATMEIRQNRELKAFYIVQLQGPGNVRVPAEVSNFAGAWVERYTADPATALVTDDEEFMVNPAAWHQLFEPYAAAKGWTGLEAEPASLEKLLVEADLLSHTG